MSHLIAVDVAILPPADVAHRARALSASLPHDPAGFRLDANHLPHITLVQSFVREEENFGRFDRLNQEVYGTNTHGIRLNSILAPSVEVLSALTRVPSVLYMAPSRT